MFLVPFFTLNFMGFKRKTNPQNLSIAWSYILSPPKFLVDLISLVNTLPNILRPSGVKSYKIHGRQALNAIYLVAPCISCCVLCVLKQRCGGNTQWRWCLGMGRLCRRPGGLSAFGKLRDVQSIPECIIARLCPLCRDVWAEFRPEMVL